MSTPDANGWLKIDSAEHYKTYLTQHEDDLYPVPAYKMPDNGADVWYRETEGPEDTFFDGGRNRPLYRAPTHYQPLPAPPVSEGEG